MAGIERARARSLNPGCICTFTAQSAPRAGEVFDFFAREGLNFSIHAALPTLGAQSAGWALAPEAHGALLIEMLDRYLANLDKVRISTLDAMCRQDAVAFAHSAIVSANILRLIPMAGFTHANVSPGCRNIVWATSTIVLRAIRSPLRPRGKCLRRVKSISRTSAAIARISIFVAANVRTTR